MGNCGSWGSLGSLKFLVWSSVVNSVSRGVVASRSRIVNTPSFGASKVCLGGGRRVARARCRPGFADEKGRNKGVRSAVTSKEKERETLFASPEQPWINYDARVPRCSPVRPWLVEVIWMMWQADDPCNATLLSMQVGMPFELCSHLLFI